MSFLKWSNVCLLVAVTFCLGACSKKKDPEPDPAPLPYETSHAEQVKKSIAGFLGKGYKGYQYYANPKSCTRPLFDLSAPSFVAIQKTPSYTGRFVSGETLSEFYDAFSANIATSGAYNGFSGEITANFSKSVLLNRSYSFITSHITQTYYRLTLTENAPLLTKVEEDLQTLKPHELFDKYGTHYLKSIYIGGRISFNSYIDRTKIEENYDLKAAVDAAYLQVIKGSAAVEAVNQTVLGEVIRNKDIDVMGGDPAKANNIVDGSGHPSDVFNLWSASVPDFMSIADFADDGLVPIYELADDPVRKATLQKAWIDYMTRNTDEVLKQGAAALVKKNSLFLLKSSDGRYFSRAPFNATYQYYYPTIDDKAQKLQFGGSQDALRNGHNVTIKTTEQFKDTLLHKWSKRVYLGAFQLKHWLYYWQKDGAKTNWHIEKVVPSADDRIHFGDQVRIRNEFFNEYLWPEKDGFLTTKQQPYTWTIEHE